VLAGQHDRGAVGTHHLSEPLPAIVRPRVRRVRVLFCQRVQDRLQPRGARLGLRSLCDDCALITWAGVGRRWGGADAVRRAGVLNWFAFIWRMASPTVSYYSSTLVLLVRLRGARRAGAGEAAREEGPQQDRRPKPSAPHRRLGVTATGCISEDTRLSISIQQTAIEGACVDATIDMLWSQCERLNYAQAHGGMGEHG